MSWLVAISLFVIAIIKYGSEISGDMILLASALFAVAGSISYVATTLKKDDKEKKEKTEE